MLDLPLRVMGLLLVLLVGVIKVRVIVVVLVVAVGEHAFVVLVTALSFVAELGGSEWSQRVQHLYFFGDSSSLLSLLSEPKTSACVNCWAVFS